MKYEGDAVRDNVMLSTWLSTREQLNVEWIGTCLSSPVLIPHPAVALFMM